MEWPFAAPAATGVNGTRGDVVVGLLPLVDILLCGGNVLRAVVGLLGTTQDSEVAATAADDEEGAAAFC